MSLLDRDMTISQIALMSIANSGIQYHKRFSHSMFWLNLKIFFYTETIFGIQETTIEDFTQCFQHTF